MGSSLSREDAKKWWLRCISCSEASITQHNRSFGAELADFEQAVGLFSGGFLHQGDACGLLHGAVLTAGVQAGLRFPNDSARAVHVAIQTAMKLVEEYPKVSGSHNCRDITRRDFNKVGDRIGYMRAGQGKQCGRLSLSWLPVSHATIEKTLDEQAAESIPSACHSCVFNAAKKIDAVTDSEAVALSGCSGGVGLSGNVCGVLATGVFALSIRRYRGRGAEGRDSQFAGALDETGFQLGVRKEANALRSAFERKFGSRLCAEITGRRFASVADYSTFISQGGCREVVDFVVGWLAQSASRSKL